MKTRRKRKARRRIRAVLAAVVVVAAIITVVAVVIVPQSRINQMPPNTVYLPGDVSGKKAGILDGTAAASLVTNAGTLEVYHSASGMMADLENGAIDCAVIDQPALKSVTHGVKGVTALDEPYYSQDFSFVVAKEDADLTQAINSALVKLGNNGVLKNIIDGYLSGSKYQYTSPANETPNKQLLLAVPSSFPPYVYQDGDGNYTGIDIDVARAVCDMLGVGVTVVPEDQGEILSSVETGKVDFAVGGFYQNDTDAASVDFTNPYASCVQLILVRK